MSRADLLAAAQWHTVRTDPGSGPPATSDEAWIPATVPGTAALAWSDAHGAPAADSIDVDASDWWFVARVVADVAGVHRLECDAIATIAEVMVDGRTVATSSSMWLPVSVDVELDPGSHEIAIVCRALRPLLDQRRPRPRWRSRLVADSGLRWIRTSLLGRMPAMSGSWAPAGPWQPVRLLAPGADGARLLALSVSVEPGSAGPVGIVEASVSVDGSETTVSLSLGDRVVEAAVESGVANVRIELDDPPLWWPHTHGEPVLVPLTVDVAGERVLLRRVGFRSLVADRRDGGFTLQVNGVPVFARGAVWTPTDRVGLREQPDELRRELGLLLAMGASMVRVVGTSVYESPAFWDLCDELGLLVWQDAMLATLDPPDDPAWLDAVAAEMRVVLTALQGRPSLAVVCGGTETEQQATMFGLPAERREMPVIATVIPAVVEEVVPGTPYVTSSPSGGDLPTHSGSGVAHWFGVGGYRRPVQDVRRAAVRFASECLAFATPPEQWSMSALVAGGVDSPQWAAGIPADRDTDWDFLDVTDHYVRAFFGEDPDEVDEGRALDLRRAAAAHAMSEVFSEWRREGSTCAGGLVLEWRDRVPGPGWGLVDVDGVPKATWHVLRRALAPVAVLLTDEGLDGLRVHVVNDGPVALEARIEITVLGRGGSLEEGDVVIAVPARGSTSVSVDGVLGVFRDVVHAYGFGEAQYSAVRAVLRDGAGAEIAAVRRLVPDQRVAGLGDPGLTQAVGRDDAGWWVEVTSTGLAPWVVIDAPGHVASDSWFHLLPGERRVVRLVPLHPACTPASAAAEPVVEVRCLAR